jgi:hypothetical protein
MKRILYLSITHKYGLLIALGLILLIKFIQENVAIPASLHPTMKSASLILYWIYAAAMINLIIFLLVILLTGNKKDEWKEWWEKSYYSSLNKTREKLLSLWVKTMIVTIPVAIYGSLFYGIIESGWVPIAILVIIATAGRLLSMNRKKTVNQ